MVRRRLWNRISNEQEDVARLKLKRLDYGEVAAVGHPVKAARLRGADGKGLPTTRRPVRCSRSPLTVAVSRPATP